MRAQTCKKGVLLRRSNKAEPNSLGGSFGKKSDKATFSLRCRLPISVAQRQWSCSRVNRQSAEIAALHVRKWEALELRKIHMIDLSRWRCESWN